ncbi:J domain-containing protein [Hwanghaeella sp.]|uniref:J domain-containing protein n=1 Tax=Hwanghaeella sp. TaxID=2605943 RepID=UPI003CCC2259
MTEAYPLHWPEGKPRTARRERARFDTTHEIAQLALMDELRRMGATHPVLSTDIPVRGDGLPYARHRAPDDPGVAVYFMYKGNQVCFACDRWDRVRDNIQAVRKTIEALRGIARWGTGDMVEAAFKGFEALPAPGKAVSAVWWRVLGVSESATKNEIIAAYREKAKTSHPDVAGGSDSAMAELNNARAEGLRVASR